MQTPAQLGPAQNCSHLTLSASRVLHRWELVEQYLHFLYQEGTSESREVMFDVTERMKAQVFLEILAQSRIPLTSAIASNLRRKREALLAEMNRSSQEIRESLHLNKTLSAADVETLLDGYASLRARWDELQSEIERELPDVPANERQSVSWTELQLILAGEPDLVVLAYFLGRKHSFLFLIEEGMLQVFELPAVEATAGGYAPTAAPAVRGLLEYAIAETYYWASYEAPFFGPFVRANRRLVAMLLAGQTADRAERWKAQGKRLLVAPDGFLYYLPWEALLVLPTTQAESEPLAAGPNASGVAALRDSYWLNVGPTTLVPSLSVWLELRRQVAQPAKSPLLAIYSVDYSASQVAAQSAALPLVGEIFPSFADLLETARAAKVVAAFRSPDDDAPIPRELFTRPLEPPRAAAEYAREGNFQRVCREEAPRYILFAGHGIYNDLFPQFSGLIFDIPRAVTDDGDGILTLEDIWALEMLATELIFLAACQGALGRLARGEGVLALTRGLMHQGAAAVVAALWVVPDMPTMDIATDFFGRVAATPTQQSATVLQQTKLAWLRRTRRFAAPHFWAGCVLWGLGWPAASSEKPMGKLG